MKEVGPSPRGRAPLWSVRCAVPDLLEDVERWQQEARVVFEEGRQVAVAPRGSGSGCVGDDPGSRIESNREKGPKRERRPALRHAKKETPGRVLPRRAMR